MLCAAGASAASRDSGNGVVSHERVHTSPLLSASWIIYAHTSLSWQPHVNPFHPATLDSFAAPLSIVQLDCLNTQVRQGRAGLTDFG